MCQIPKHLDQGSLTAAILRNWGRNQKVGHLREIRPRKVVIKITSSGTKAMELKLLSLRRGRRLVYVGVAMTMRCFWEHYHLYLRQDQNAKFLVTQKNSQK